MTTVLECPDWAEHQATLAIDYGADDGSAATADRYLAIGRSSGNAGEASLRVLRRIDAVWSSELDSLARAKMI